MTAGILVFNGAEELDFVGPWEMLSMWGKVANGPTCILVAEKLQPVVCAKGLSVNPDTDFETCPQLDYLVVPGGLGTRREVHNRPIVEFIRTQSLTCKAVLSVCTGAFLLHAAGLHHGKRATTHWGSLDRLRALGDVSVVQDRYTQDGNIWTSAGVSAGIDMSLAFIAETAGEDVAGQVQLQAEYYPFDTRFGGVESLKDAPAYVTRTAPR